LSSAPAAVIAYVVSRRCPAALGVGENTNTGSVTSCQARLRRRAAEEGNQVNNGHHAAGHRRASARMQLAALDCEMSTRLVARRNNRQRSASFYSWITSCSTPAKSYQKKNMPDDADAHRAGTYACAVRELVQVNPFVRSHLSANDPRSVQKQVAVVGHRAHFVCQAKSGSTRQSSAAGSFSNAVRTVVPVFLFCSYKTGNRFFFPKINYCTY
jgi:hypothetical protein